MSRCHAPPAEPAGRFPNVRRRSWSQAFPPATSDPGETWQFARLAVVGRTISSRTRLKGLRFLDDGQEEAYCEI
jgi:hypothetical protein